MIKASDIFHGNILIVDDKEANVLLLERMLHSAGYVSVTSTMAPETVCELHLKNHYDLILLDILMPGMDGFQVMEELKEIEPQDFLHASTLTPQFHAIDGLTESEPGGYLPVIVITAQADHKLRALKAGARDFVSKPFELAEVLVRVHNMLEVRLLYKQLHNNNEALELRVQERTAELHESYLETIFTLTRAAEYKDEDTGAHVQRISYYCRELAKIMGLDEAFVDKIFLASPMHDIGKIGIPDHILLKPGSFKPDEWEVMKTHAAMGAKILGNSQSPYLMMGAMIALNHHERWDGGGYPNGKRGEDIPLAARIMYICDIYDALRSKRPYKPAFDHLKTMNIIIEGDGRTQPEHFDPAILEAFQQNHQSFRDIFDAHSI